MLLFKDRIETKLSFTYQQLFNFLNSTEPVIINFKQKQTSLYLFNFIKAICNQIDLTLLDLDFTNEEVLNLTQKNYEPIVIQKQFIEIQNIEDLKTHLQNSKSILSIFTSGTTGQPKVVEHTVQNLIRNTKIGPKYQGNCWGLAYNPTHIAGVQVLFQALLNGCSLINLFEATRNEVYDSIKLNGITHISATPTFFRLLLPFEQQCENIQNISIGGEKSSEILIENLKKIFPFARINNIYASTEAGSLFASHGVGFKIPNSKKEYIKIEKNEIYVHQTLLGNSKELQNETWFSTGDLIEWINEEEGYFKIISRKNELLNIGGNKVNPAEVEQCLEAIDGIKEAYVYGRPNSVLGTILCCDICCEENISELDIKQQLKEKLQPIKIPRKFYFKTAMEVTRNGKIKRDKNVA
jgi:acyl-coenzyme A synthetase/AMP-(fatty) acid ligase